MEEYVPFSQITYWGEIDYGRAQSIEIPLSIISELLNKPSDDVKNQVRNWYEEGNLTDAQRESRKKS